MKAEQQFLSLINATVSHELRNPLSSLIGQITELEENLKSLQKLLISLPSEDENTKKLKQIYTGISKCGRKLKSAAKFIDFFVHDILDYTILMKKESNFSKNNKVFDIKEAV